MRGVMSRQGRLLRLLLVQRLREDEQNQEQVHERTQCRNVEDGSDFWIGVADIRSGAVVEDGVANEESTESGSQGEAEEEDTAESTENVSSRTIRGTVGYVGRGRALKSRPSAQKALNDRRDNEKKLTMGGEDTMGCRD